ncbi:hypothetical protein EVU96_08775 [Bacillus infantis]|uniref:hypothetical protein n=1 Tax=Bacillus infantis TaxID=324767 RepID=UPI00101B8BDA|nr:hypothetical protein [Bacillus infantis]RYI30497.1 hypothetical protein EVU96_08775 [Bacillus infantis]
MKYHITPKQAKQITEDQFYSMFNEIVPREDWANCHHRKMTIGKMIDYLDEVTIGKSIVDGLWNVFTLDEENYTGKELTDALWEAVKADFQKEM